VENAIFFDALCRVNEFNITYLLVFGLKVFPTDIRGSISLQTTFHIGDLLDVQPQSIFIQWVVPSLHLVLEFSPFFIRQKDVIGVK
uniref:Uncharacterized protein n=1 Tax=Romanomermis culicivorax TaxID=13658 RepID=A0A915IYE0_ROMCU